MDQPDEILDLVDDNDVVIGKITRGAFDGAAGNVRAAELFIMNDRGEIWIPRRTLHKKSYPGGIDLSAAEHVTAGESYVQAIIRGVAEELNLTIAPNDVVLLGILPPDKLRKLPVFRAVFLLRLNKDPHYNPDDFMSAEWVEPKVLLARLKNGESAKRSVESALELLLKSELLANF